MSFGNTAHAGADPIGGLRGLQPPYWLQPPLEARGELGKKKMGEEENRERRGWGRSGRRHQHPLCLLATSATARMQVTASVSPRSHAPPTTVVAPASSLLGQGADTGAWPIGLDVAAVRFWEWLRQGFNLGFEGWESIILVWKSCLWRHLVGDKPEAICCGVPRQQPAAEPRRKRVEVDDDS